MENNQFTIEHRPFDGGESWREFLMQLNSENSKTKFMVDYENREIITLEELLPECWGVDRL